MDLPAWLHMIKVLATTFLYPLSDLGQWILQVILLLLSRGQLDRNLLQILTMWMLKCKYMKREGSLAQGHCQTSDTILDPQILKYMKFLLCITCL